MLLLDVSTRDFRNLADQRVALGPHSTVLFGANGQGKTNFLEACYLLCTLRPLRAHKLFELARIGSERPALVTGRFELPSGVREVEVEVAREGRTARVDGKPVRDPEELFGGLATVAFTPDDLAVVKGGPEGRRKLLDRAAQNRHPSHVSDARDYLRALRSRNELLRQGAEPALLASFDEPLAALGARVRARREEVLDEIRPHAQKAYAEVTRGEAALGIDYLAAGRDSDDLAGGGPSLQPRLLQALQGRAPLLLLDDVSSELDPERNAFLMGYLAALNGQVVLTTTDPKLVAASAAKEALFRRVEGGRIAPENLVFSE